MVKKVYKKKQTTENLITSHLILKEQSQMICIIMTHNCCKISFFLVKRKTSKKERAKSWRSWKKM